MKWLKNFGTKASRGSQMAICPHTASSGANAPVTAAPGANAGQSRRELSASPPPGKVDAVRIEVTVARKGPQQVSFTVEIPLSGAPVKMLEDSFQLRVLGFIDAEVARARKVASC